MTDEHATHTRESDEVLRVAVAILNAEELPNIAGWAPNGLRAAAAEAHSGDCTKQPWSCNACIAQKAIEVAEAAIFAMATPIPLTPSDEMVEAGAKALWDNYQSHSYTQWSSNDLMYGKEWRGKIVPWEYVTGPEIVESVAKDYRNQAKACLQAALNLMGGKM